MFIVSIFLSIVALIFVLTTIYFISGRGGWLISGYNMLQAKEKAKYDEKRLYKWIGYTISLPSSLFFISVIAFLESEIRLGPISLIYAIYMINIVIYSNIKNIGKLK